MGTARYPSMQERIIANTTVIPGLPLVNGEPCWIWTSVIAKNGYGRISWRMKRGPRKGQVVNHLVHRVAVAIFKGRRVTPGMKICHLCDVRPCCNPAHLLGGSAKTNSRQMVERGRIRSPFIPGNVYAQSRHLAEALEAMEGGA